MAKTYNYIVLERGLGWAINLEFKAMLTIKKIGT